ncbi:MAG: Periplasmic pH-dependent serine endoprotease DegQ [Chlamydiae bacterium]|nr:Periplasmic pH-dependent serine endoprotease DegQ [Chlamydiota bacterium]
MRLRSLTILCFCLISCLQLNAFGKPLTPPMTNSSKQSSPITVLKEVSEGFSQVAENAIPAVVSIKASFESHNSSNPEFNDFFYHFFGSVPQQTEPTEGFGSGFFVSDDGYILTNNHLVKNATEIKVTLHDGNEYDAEIVGSDPNTEVALIKVKGKNFPFLALADSDKVKIGQWAIAIGNPLQFEASVTVGVISAVGRNSIGNSRWKNYIQTDAAINPGSSGGPLLNINGEVVGINTAIVTKTGGYMGLSFAIPSNIAKHIAEQLFDQGYIETGYLGICAQPLTPDLAKALNLDSHHGVVIVEVTADSPAQKAGLLQQDVILKFNGKPLTNQVNLTHEVSLLKPGTKVTLTINRDGKVKQLNATIGLHPSDQEGASATTIPSQNALGITVENLTPEYESRFGYEHLNGVIITQVKPNSQIAIASIRPGTLILSVNRHKVNNVQEFEKYLAESAKNKRVLLLVRYGKITRYVTINMK